MINRFLTLPKSIKILVFAIAGSLCLILAVFVVLQNKLHTSSDQSSIIKFEYCGVAPQELCVLSFGRDGTGNAIINFFVPDKKFPDFYLVIKKAGIENIYECKKNAEIKTSVYCSGNPLSLKQAIEINIFARNDGRQLATGNFFIEAFLVSSSGTQNVVETNTLIESSPTITATIPSTTTAIIGLTLTPTILVTAPTMRPATKTATPLPYPNPPYP